VQLVLKTINLRQHSSQESLQTPTIERVEMRRAEITKEEAMKVKTESAASASPVSPSTERKFSC
jgi:hypothetical protein